jgi:hypothetical protein
MKKCWEKRRITNPKGRKIEKRSKLKESKLSLSF